MLRVSDACEEWLEWNEEWVITAEGLCKYEALFE